VPGVAVMAGGPPPRVVRHARVVPSESLAAGAQGDSAAPLRHATRPASRALWPSHPRSPWRPRAAAANPSSSESCRWG